MQDNYLAEKTLPTIRKWLEDKDPKKSYDLVPFYAFDDFMEKLGQNPARVVYSMNSEKNVGDIKKALDAIAVSCECKKTSMNYVSYNLLLRYTRLV
jgi:hypothetical protein